MYESLGRRRDANLTAGARARADRLYGHRPAQFLRRHVRACRDVQKVPQRDQEFQQGLLTTIADPRMLMAAFESLTAKGGTAPGPDGVEFDTLSSHDGWMIARCLGQIILNGSYRPGPVRQLAIPKPGKAGQRVLTIDNVVDRIAAKATQLTVTPLIDPTFDERCHGGRPGRDRNTALWHAESLMQQEGRYVLVTADLEKAFDNVPCGRLPSLLRQYLPADVINLIVSFQRGRRKGIGQGCPMSPLLLNVYLTHVLDRRWRSDPNLPPMIRNADDLLLVCRDTQEACTALERLQEILVPTGMKLRPDATQEADLQGGETIDWLGYNVGWREGSLQVSIPATSWEKLADGLSEAHRAPRAVQHAQSTVRGWLEQAAATFPTVMHKDVLAHVREIATLQAWEEIPSDRELLRSWRTAYRAYLRRRWTWDVLYGAGSSAAALEKFEDRSTGRGGCPVSAGQPSAAGAFDYQVYCDGGHRRGDPSLGGCAFVVLDFQGRVIRQARKTFRGGSAPLAELLAAIGALEATPPGSRIELVSDSRYVVDAIQDALAHWAAQQWRAGPPGRSRRLKHVALWRRLDALMQQRKVVARWVRGHSGDAWNEVCDQLVEDALER
ncbi:MAG: hypothetical protein K1X74_02175 [Pirellulales bacterium]|nr:hypothetical protein [Pirellulales bacterium]